MTLTVVTLDKVKGIKTFLGKVLLLCTRVILISCHFSITSMGIISSSSLLACMKVIDSSDVWSIMDSDRISYTH